MNYYRIITDRWCGFEVQVWRWWWPFWVMPKTNTRCTEEQAVEWLRNYLRPTIEFIPKVVREIRPEELQG